ncbi:MAG: aminopeptidase P N-terminal domain-containing protein [Bacteroidales bacterium]|nr:aminopeptidase P N-terminal domain-containing protein [Bacteroidales bacterium]
MNSLEREFHTQNRHKLLDQIGNGDTVILFSANPQSRNANQFFRYRQNSDILYYSGIQQEETILLLHKKNTTEAEEYAFIIEPTEHINVWTGIKLTKAEITNVSGIANVEYLDKFDSIADEIINSGQGRVFLSFGNNIRKAEYINFRQEAWKKLHSNLDFYDIDPITTTLRLQKSEYEIGCIREAIRITKNAFAEVSKIIRPGIHEYEIEAEFYKQIRGCGCDGFAYQPVISSGSNNCILQSINNQGICHDGDLLIMDVGAEYKGYAADITRTIPINGKFSPRQQQVYDEIMSIQRQIKQYYVPGSSIDRIHSEFEKLMLEALQKLNLVTKDEIAHQESVHTTVKRYSPHLCSHFIGLDVHDVGNRHTILKSGMVMSCEPAIYIPEEGFGIRMETDMLVGEKPVDLGDISY